MRRIDSAPFLWVFLEVENLFLFHFVHNLGNVIGSFTLQFLKEVDDVSSPKKNIIIVVPSAASLIDFGFNGNGVGDIQEIVFVQMVDVVVWLEHHIHNPIQPNESRGFIDY